MQLDEQLVVAIIKKKWLLHAPQDRKDLVDIYHELDKYKEFSIDRIRPLDLLFAWYFAAPSSPFADKNKNIRIQMACEVVYGNRSEEKYREFEHGFSQSMLEAIARFGRFEIGPRAQARVLIDKRLRDIRTLMGQPIEEALKGDDGYIDWGKAKDHTDVMVKCGKELQELIGMAEGRSMFGVTEDDGELEKGELAAIALKRFG